MKTAFVLMAVFVIPALAAAQGISPPVPTNQLAAPAPNTPSCFPGDNTIKVPGDYPTIQQAINYAFNGNLVLVSPGTYVENLNFKGKAITVMSEQGPETTVIDGNQLGSVVMISNNAVLDGFTITNGLATEGGGIDAYYATIRNNIITENIGSGIYCGDSVVTNNIIKHNTESGICYPSGSLITYNTITENSGGGIRCGSTASWIINNIISYNSSSYYGGGISWSNPNAMGFPQPYIVNCVIYGNSATSGGGGIYFDGFTDSFFGGGIKNTILWNNQASAGSEIFLGYGSFVDIEYSILCGGMGGVCESGGKLNLKEGIIDLDPLIVDPDNGDFHLSILSPCIDAGHDYSFLPDHDFDGDPRCFDGDADGTAVVDMGVDECIPIRVPMEYPTIQTAIQSAPEGGDIVVAPGIYQENIDFLGKGITVSSGFGPLETILDGGQTGSVATFQNSEGPDSLLAGFTIINGSAQKGGGVFCSSSSPVIWENIIALNTATSGGGLFVGTSSTPTLVSNTFYNNMAYEGGGICCMGSSPKVTNNVFLGNAADSGGGFFVGTGSSLILTNNTFYGNFATTSGGGLESGNEFVEVWNSILWNNTAPLGPEIHGTNAAVSHCDVMGGWPGTGNLDADPCFKDPATGDLSLAPSSPCIEAGDNNAPELPVFDFEWDPRIVYDHVDMGVDEYDLGGVVWTVPDEYPAIQDAIDIALEGDLIVVKPGTYVENIDFLGKKITVKSEEGPLATVLDGNQSGRVVLMENDAVLDGFTITNGDTTSVGGGIYVSSATVNNNILSGNTAHEGGGIYSIGSSMIVNNIITGNMATRGGGIYSFDSPLIVNNTLYWNTAVKNGGGIWCIATPTIVNNTLYGNSAGDQGGGLLTLAVTNMTVTNTIFCNNIAPTGSEIQGNPTVTYCNVKGGFAGTGNIDEDPLFLDPLNGDFHLSNVSSCIDVGNNHAASLPVLDFEGDPRIFPGNGTGVYVVGSPPPGAIVDMGADEYCLLKRKKLSFK